MPSSGGKAEEQHVFPRSVPLRASCGVTLGRDRSAVVPPRAVDQRSELLRLRSDSRFHRSTTSSQLHEKRCVI